MSRPTVSGLQTEVAELHALVADLQAQIADLRAAIGTEVRTRRLVVVDEKGAERITATVRPGDETTWAELEVNDGEDNPMAVRIYAVRNDMSSEPALTTAAVSLMADGNEAARLASHQIDSRRQGSSLLLIGPEADLHGRRLPGTSIELEANQDEAEILMSSSTHIDAEDSYSVLLQAADGRLGGSSVCAATPTSEAYLRVSSDGKAVGVR